MVRFVDDQGEKAWVKPVNGCGCAIRGVCDRDDAGIPNDERETQSGREGECRETDGEHRIDDKNESENGENDHGSGSANDANGLGSEW